MNLILDQNGSSIFFLLFIYFFVYITQYRTDKEFCEIVLDYLYINHKILKEYKWSPHHTNKKNTQSRRSDFLYRSANYSRLLR